MGFGSMEDMIFLVHTAVLLVALIFIAMTLTPLVAES